MQNSEIISNLHKMVDRFGEMLDNPICEGVMPLIRITLKSDDDRNHLRLTVGADFVEDDA